MVLVCPACGARYAPPENAIPAAGRLVRCSACRAEWRASPADDARDAPEPRVSAALIPTPAPAAERTPAAAAGPSAMAASLESPPPYEPGGRGGFMAGFTVVALLALGAVAVYVKHEAVVDAVPALAGVIDGFVATVDDMRQRLADLVAGL